MKRDEILSLRYIAIPESVAQHQGLTPAAKLVYGVLLGHLGENDSCWPGTARLAKATGLEPRSIKKCMKLLVKAQLVEIIGSGRNRVNIYCLKLPSSSEQNSPPVTQQGSEQNSPQGSEQNSPQVVNKVHHQSGTKFTASGEQNSPELINITNTPINEGNQPKAAKPPKAAAAAEGSSRHDHQTSTADQSVKAKPPIPDIDGGSTTSTECRNPKGSTAEDMTMKAEDSPHSTLAAASDPAGAAADDDVDPVLDAMNDPSQPDPDEFGGIGDSDEDYRDAPDTMPEIRFGASAAVDGSSRAPARPDEPEAPPCKPRTAPAVQATTKKRTTRQCSDQKMSSQDKELICKSAQAMNNWLCLGAEGLKAQTAEELKAIKPSTLDWHVHGGTFEDPKFDQWTIPQIAGYYWMRVSFYREEHGIQITIPMMGVLIGKLNTLEKTMPRSNLWQYIHTVVDRFDLIKAIKGNTGATLTLNEHSLLNPIVRDGADSISRMDEQEMNKMCRKHRI